MKALIHYNTFLFNSSQKKLGSSNIFVFFIIFYHVLDIFRLGKPKKITSICIPTDGNFPIFENSTLSSRRKSDFILPCIFIRIRYTVTFCELWPYVIPFHSSVELQLTWSTFPKKSSSFQADKSPASLIRKFPSLCFRYLCFSCGVKTPKTSK